MKGFDIDGVLIKGIASLIPNTDDILITGRSFETAPETYSLLQKKGIFNAIYFNPVKFENVTIENSALWKVKVIDSSSITKFYDDDARQIDLINKYSKRVQNNFCIVIQVG